MTHKSMNLAKLAMQMHDLSLGPLVLNFRISMAGQMVGRMLRGIKMLLSAYSPWHKRCGEDEGHPIALERGCQQKVLEY